MEIGQTFKEMFLLHLEKEELQCMSDTVDQKADNCVQVLTPLLKWLEIVQPSI